MFFPRPNLHLEVTCPFHLDYLPRLFLKSPGENLNLCHTPFPASLIRPGSIRRSEEPDRTRLMPIGFFFFFTPLMIPVVEKRKTNRERGDFRAGGSPLSSEPLSTASVVVARGAVMGVS